MEPRETRFNAFDTSIRLRVWGEAAPMEEALLRARGACAAYERLLSRTIPSSDIGRLNHANGAWVSVDEVTLGVIKAALRYCAASQGAFDITVGSATRLWDLKRGIVPSAEALANAVQHVDWRCVQVDEQGCRVRLADPDAMVDLGGIAKGWIADELERSFMERGALAWLIDLGGNILVGGEKPDGEPWKIALPALAPEDEKRMITLRRGSVVTSGTYERTCVVDGVRYHHILDPKTGMPIAAEYPAVSVVCERSLDAEGYSTTLLALGPERARAFAADHPEILQVYYTKG